MEKTSVDRCAEWLYDLLSAGDAECGGIREDAKALGFSKQDLREARRLLSVRTWHQIDTLDEPRIDNWFWGLSDMGGKV